MISAWNSTALMMKLLGLMTTQIKKIICNKRKYEESQQI